MDNWDPMTEDFVSTLSSTVSNQGPLKNFSRSRNFNDGKVNSFKECDRLHIKNVPMNMTADNLKNFLSNHGNVLSVRLLPPNEVSLRYNKLAAIANVQSSQDVLSIISALNNKEPLCLKLEKGLSQEEYLKRKNIYPNFQPERNYNHNTNHEDTIIADEKLLKNNAEPLMSLKKMLVNCKKSKIGNENEAENIPNKFQIRNVSSVNSKKEIPEIKKSVYFVSQGNGKRFKNPYPCVRCGIMGMKRCSVCKAYYCSKECQEDDWFYHLKICKPPPMLEESDYETSFNINKDSKEICLEATENISNDCDANESEHFIKFNKDNSPRYSKSISINGKPLRKPLLHGHKNIDSIIAAGSNIEYISKKESMPNGNDNVIQSSSNDIKQSQSMTPLEERTEASTALEEKSDCNTPKRIISDNIINTSNLKSVTFSKNNVDMLETSKYKLQKLMEKIDNVHSNASANKSQPVLEDLCIISCEFDDTSTKKVVANLDGSIETTEINTGVNGITSNDNCKIIDVINTKDNVHENVTAKYECGKIYEVVVISKESEKDFTVMAQFEYTDVILFAEQSSLSAGTLLMHTELACNEVIVAKSLLDNEWYRAKICSVEADGFVKVCYVDYGNMEDVKEIRSLPLEFNCSQFPGLAMNVTLYKNIPREQLTKFDELVKIEEKIKFKVMATKASSIKIVFIDEYDKELAVCIMKPWYLRKLPPVNGNGPSVNGQIADSTAVLSMDSSSVKIFKHQLKSLIIVNGQKCDVILTWILDDLNISLQMASEENTKLLADILKKTELHCDKASKPSMENLMENELVCASLDDVWYRGEIINFCDAGINVHFLDFGNTDLVPLDKIRAFDASLLDIPILCLKVKPIVDHLQRQKANDLFCNFLAKEEKFIMKVVSLVPLEAIMMDCEGNNLFPDASQSDPNIPSAHLPSIQRIPLNTITEEPVDEQEVHCVSTDKSIFSENLTNCEQLRKFYRNELTSLMVVNGEEYTVIITWILEDLTTCLHIVSAENVSSLHELIGMTTAHCQNASKLTTDELRVNEVVCAAFEDMWCRGEVINIDDNKISIYFLDFGNTDVVPLDNIRVFDPSLLDIPILCLQVKPIIKQHQIQIAKDIFNSYLKNEEKFVMKVVSLEPPLEAVMMDCLGKDLFPDALPSTSSSETHKNITGESIDKKVTQLLQSGAYKPIFKSWDECESVVMPIQEDVDVFIMKASNPQNIFVVPAAYSKLFGNLDELSVKFNEYCSTIKTPYYAPREGEVVLAKFSEDEKWYRAACVDVQGEMAEVFFVDYGNVEKVNFRNLCQMIDVFLDIPLFVLHCILGDTTKRRLVSRNEDYLSNFGDILLDNSFNTVDVLSHNNEDGTYVIEIPSLCSTP